MEPDQISPTIFYNSLYRHGVDDKRRVQIPAKWRPGKPEAFTLILWPKGSAADSCLLVSLNCLWEFNSC